MTSNHVDQVSSVSLPPTIWTSLKAAVLVTAVVFIALVCIAVKMMGPTILASRGYEYDFWLAARDYSWVLVSLMPIFSCAASVGSLLGVKLFKRIRESRRSAGRLTYSLCVGAPAAALAAAVMSVTALRVSFAAALFIFTVYLILGTVLQATAVFFVSRKSFHKTE